MGSLVRVAMCLACLALVASCALALDVTVVVGSDTHFEGTSPSGNVQACIQSMNGIAGVAYPSSVGGAVAGPSAAILCGDLCTGGFLFDSASDTDYRNQWSGFDYYFPKPGDPAAGRLHYPTYAASGNHDYYRVLGTLVLNPSPSYVVAQNLMGRYGSGTGGTQEGNVCYSVDLGGVHFACVGRYADDQVLAWLGGDLAATPRGTPIVIFLHYAFDDGSLWYTDGEREALAARLVGHRVVCILHGHTHAAHSYVWHAIPVFDDGATDEDRDFGVLRVTDSGTVYAQRQVASGGDYWKWAAQYCTITGYARSMSGGIAGATLSASNGGGTVSTGVDGYYCLSVPVGWSGTVTPSKQGVVFSTPPRSYGGMQSSVAGQDYFDSSFRVLAINNRDLAHLSGAAEKFLFAAFGRVSRVDDSTLQLDDGSETPIRVQLAGHSLQTGDYAVARGEWMPSTVPPTLNAFSIAKLQ